MDIDTSNSNEQRTSLSVGLDSKFGLALRRSTEATINLDVLNRNLQVLFKDNEDTYDLNVRKLKSSNPVSILLFTN